MRRPASFALLMLASTALAAAAPDAAHRASYDLSIGSLTLGTMERSLAIDASGRYRFESRMQTRGLAALLRREQVAETSTGMLLEGRFRPEHYAYANTRKRRHYELVFDHAAGVVRRTDDSARAWQQSFDGALFDKLVYQAQLMLDLADDPAIVDYGIADEDELKRYVLERRGEEDVSTPHGRYATVRFERAQPGSTRRTTVWCAPALAWLPVRVDYRDKDGKVTTALLRSLSRPREPGLID